MRQLIKLRSGMTSIGFIVLLLCMHFVYAPYTNADEGFSYGSDEEPTTPVTRYSVKTSVPEPTPLPIRENVMPFAHAGVDLVVSSGALVVLDASMSRDPDGNIASYSWRQLSGPHVELLSSRTPNPSFIAGDSPTTHIFQVTVRDGDGMSAIDLVTVVVQQRPVPSIAPDTGSTPVPSPTTTPEIASSLGMRDILFILLGGILIIVLGIGIKKGWNYFFNNATN